MVKVVTGKTPTQAPLINGATQFLDKSSASGLSIAGLRALQAIQAQKPFNPTLVPAALSPMIVDSVHNVLFITTGGAPFSLILGPSKTSPFSMYIVIQADGTGVITVAPTGTDTINGAGILALTAAQWRATVLIPDGKSNWEAFSIAGGG